jgi:hypothetical protein
VVGINRILLVLLVEMVVLVVDMGDWRALLLPTKLGLLLLVNESPVEEASPASRETRDKTAESLMEKGERYCI